LDRRTNGPEGSGGASPTIVTSRAADEVDSDSETLASGIMAAPPRRRTARKLATEATPATTAPANGDISDRKANGTVAASDTPARDTDQVMDAPSAAGPAEASGQDGARGVDEDVTLADIPAVRADQIGPAASGTGSSGTASSGTASSGTGSSASSGSSPPVNQTPTVSPAAFAWEMPDPPPSSPSSPARTFLRAGSNVKSAITSRTPGMTGPGPAKPATGEGKPATGEGKLTIGEGRPAAAAAPPRSGSKKASSKRSARQAHLTVARVEPWSVMKFSFVVSLVAFVILFVAVSLLYGALDGLGVFDSLQRLVSSLTSSQGSAGVNASKWFSASRVLGYTALLGSLNIVLITAMSTIGAVVYNLTSRLVGGVEVTLRETE
jgi:Transmembrane domain of unknown function (DUF3566)